MEVHAMNDSSSRDAHHAEHGRRLPHGAYAIVPPLFLRLPGLRPPPTPSAA
jgi:hypothetical protein